MKKIFKNYEKNGFVKIEKVFKKNFISKIINDINNAKKIDKYFDKYGNIRRVEKLYNKSQNLKKLDLEIRRILKKIMIKDYLIFKDKYNAKPPGGEGFFPHYDGIFKFKDKKNKIQNGWYIYGKDFVNVLVALDKCTKKNGTIQISNSHNGDFDQLYKNTKMNGTPELNQKILKFCKFKIINLNIGDIVIFKNTCPHKSETNKTVKSRRNLYYTYLNKSYGNKYNKYFQDKNTSKNKSSKSLSTK